MSILSAKVMRKYACREVGSIQNWGEGNMHSGVPLKNDSSVLCRGALDQKFGKSGA